MSRLKTFVCTQKKTFTTRKNAQKYARKGAEIYQCDICKNFHISGGDKHRPGINWYEKMKLKEQMLLEMSQRNASQRYL